MNGNLATDPVNRGQSRSRSANLRVTLTVSQLLMVVGSSDLAYNERKVNVYIST